MDRRFRESGGVKVWTVVWCALIVGFVGAVMYPVLVRFSSMARASTCPSNMNSIGKAIKSYMTDWDDTFPTNRNNTLGDLLCYHVVLSPRHLGDEDTVKFFAHGRNWVESLYNVSEHFGYPGKQSVYTCPEAKQVHSDTACVSYAINYNLLESPESCIRLPMRTMMLRELDRIADAECRPVNRSDGPDRRPVGAFLTEIDPYLGTCNPILHGSGSNILLADGHVGTFNKEFMPTDDKLVYDKKTKQWWNGAGKTIAITP